MKLGIRDHIDDSAGVQQETRISFEANGVAFYAQISGLAKDKIGYPIRELSTNAWDASRGDMEVHLPTTLNPIFRVRDYGTGMSADQMENVYARLYASTKRGSNNEVGGWGLGSKSPFAYLINDNGAGSYTVTSYHEGVMRTYVLSLANDGTPVMRKLVEAPTTERSGMDVSFPVRREDIVAFHERARLILWSFQPRPAVTPNLNWSNGRISAQGDGWTRFEHDSVPFRGPHVRMGCVMYPFDIEQIETGGFLARGDAILFEAPIDTLKVTLSREELAYDANTKATLNELVKRYEDSFKAHVQARVSEQPTYFEACSAFEDECSTLGAHRTDLLRMITKWNGKDLVTRISGPSFSHTPFKTMRLRTGWTTFDKFDHGAFEPHLACDYKVVMEHNPSYSLQRLAMADLVGEKILWVRTKRLFRDAVLEILGNPEVIDLDTYKVAPTERRPKNVRKRRTLQVSDRGMHLLTQEVDMAAGGLYVTQYSRSRSRHRSYENYLLGGDHHHITGRHALDSAVALSVELGFLEADQTILVLADSEVPGENWHPLADEIMDPLKALVNVEEFTGLHQKSTNSIDGKIKLLTEIEGLRAPSDLTDFIADATVLVGQLRAAGEVRSTNSDRAFAVLKSLGVHIEIPHISCPIEAMQNRFQNIWGKYPLMEAVYDNWNWQWKRDEIHARIKHYFELEAIKEAYSSEQSEEALLIAA